MSSAEVHVEEGQYAPRIMCSAKAYPGTSHLSHVHRYSSLTWHVLNFNILFFSFLFTTEPSYIWIRNGEMIAKTNALIMNKPMQHADGGLYICIAKNKHGNHSAETNINILCKYNAVCILFSIL